MTDLVVVVPTRGRPERAAELAQALASLNRADTRMLLAIDEDDQALPEYSDIPRCFPFADLCITAADAGHVGAINQAAARALADYQPFAVAKLDDDHRPRTVGFDVRYLEALRELGAGIVYGNDLLQGERLPTAPALTADIIQALGYMGLPSLRHLAVDDFWRELGAAAGCLRYLPGVIVEHMHPTAGKAAWDEGYRRANSSEMYERDLAEFARYQREDLAADVAKVRSLLGRQS